MAEASRIVLDGFTLRTTCRVIEHTHRLGDQRGAVVWKYVEQAIDELKGKAPPAQGTCSPAPRFPYQANSRPIYYMDLRGRMVMPPLDVDRFRIARNSRRSAPRPPRPKTREQFLKGPIPLDWLTAAARLPGKSLQVAVAVWFLAGLHRSSVVPLSNKISHRFGLDRNSKYRALAWLEAQGLITVERKIGRAPVVTIQDQNCVEAGSNTRGRGKANLIRAWPRLMRASTAAAYVDERSVGAFRRSVGKLWPKPLKLAGKGERWLKEDLDAAIERSTGRAVYVRDAADVL